MAQRVAAVEGRAPCWPDALALSAAGTALLLLPGAVQAITPQAARQAPAVALPGGAGARCEWSALAAAPSGRAWAAVDTEGRLAVHRAGEAEAALTALPESEPALRALCVAWAEGAGAGEGAFAVGTQGGAVVHGAHGAALHPTRLPVIALAWRGAELALAHPHARLSLLRLPSGPGPAELCGPSESLLPLPAAALSALRWQPGAPLLAAAACSDLLFVCAAADAPRLLHVVAAAHSAPLTGLQWGADGVLYTAALDGAFRLWRWTGAECHALATLVPPSRRPLWGLAIAPLATHALLVAAQPPDLRRAMYSARTTSTLVLAVPLPLPAPLPVPARPAAAAWEVALLSAEHARQLVPALQPAAASPVALAQLRALLCARAGDLSAARTARSQARLLVWRQLLDSLAAAALAAFDDDERTSIALISLHLSAPPPLPPLPPELCSFCASPVSHTPTDEAVCTRGHRLARCMRSALLLAPAGNVHCAACGAHARPLSPARPFFAALLAAFPGCAFCSAPLQ